jgi:hypothetical protein
LNVLLAIIAGAGFAQYLLRVRASGSNTLPVGLPSAVKSILVRVAIPLTSNGADYGHKRPPLGQRHKAVVCNVADKG